MDLIVSIFFLMMSFVLFGISFRAVYFAFIKKKDERSKWVVKKSMADSFIVIIIFQTIFLAIKFVNYGFYQQWWSNFKERIYIEPILLSFAIFGIIIIFNGKRYGGSI